MARTEREPITGSGGGAPSGVQGQSPWSGGQSPLKLKTFQIFYAQKEGENLLSFEDFSIVFKVV